MATLNSSAPQDDVRSATFKLLISHLLAAKRALGCVEHVSRANSLVKDTRIIFEEQTIEAARCQFLHTSSVSQVQVLQRIQRHNQAVVKDSVVEFTGVARKFEEAEYRLNFTLEQLKATVVESSLRPDDDAPKSLADFVDESGVQQLRATVQETLDAMTIARREYEKNAAEFNSEVLEAGDLLSDGEEVFKELDLQNSRSSPLPTLLERMEEHAQEMANNLESLVKHFDLCIAAIKHLDGGVATASEITEELPEALRMQLNQSHEIEPIGPDERYEMLEVLQKDADEVEDVVAETKNSLAIMEADFERVCNCSERLIERSSRTMAALNLLDDIGNRLPKFMTQSQLFLIRWEEEKAKIQGLMEEFGGLCEFYVEFLGAYNCLIIEVGRRKDTEKRIEKVRNDAITKIEKLLAEEVAERNHFRQTQGDFLPVDIWPGLMKAPARYHFSIVEGSEDSVPDISASTINRAIRGLEKEQR